MPEHRLFITKGLLITQILQGHGTVLL
jgi:hypothetical protein